MLVSFVPAVVACNVTAPRICTLVLFIVMRHKFKHVRCWHHKATPILFSLLVVVNCIVVVLDGLSPKLQSDGVHAPVFLSLTGRNDCYDH